MFNFDKKQLLLLALVIILCIGYFGYRNTNLLNRQAENNSKFYEQSFSAYVISTYTYEDYRRHEYSLDNGLNIYFLYQVEGRLKIGDSIVKKENIYNYDVYRKNNNNKYEFSATFNFEEME